MSRSYFTKRTILQGVMPAVLLFWIQSSSVAQITQDAVVLTLRVQEGIHLDSTLAQHIDSGLVAARQEVDTLESIHALWDYVLTDLSVKTFALWRNAWQQGQILTGEPYIDSLALEFGLVSVAPTPLDWFLLDFAAPLQMERLGELYALHIDVVYAHPNYFGGDGDQIEYLEKNGVMLFAFSHGWGDCPAGCINRYYWYVSVVPTPSGFAGTLDEERFRSWTQPYIYRWNIPPRYAMTMFPNADSILYSITGAQDWWVRRHAIEGTWRFFVASSPWTTEDYNSHWNTLKDELLSRSSEVVDTLEVALLDIDPDVRASAEYAITRIRPVSVDEKEIKPSRFKLHQNYPNPFNPTTTIRFSVGTYGPASPAGRHTSLRVFDVLGREVATLVNEMKQPGTFDVTWDAREVASGVYFYKFKAGDFVETKRMVLIR